MSSFCPKHSWMHLSQPFLHLVELSTVSFTHVWWFALTIWWRALNVSWWPLHVVWWSMHTPWRRPHSMHISHALHITMCPGWRSHHTPWHGSLRTHHVSMRHRPPHVLMHHTSLWWPLSSWWRSHHTSCRSTRTWGNSCWGRSLHASGARRHASRTLGTHVPVTAWMTWRSMHIWTHHALRRVTLVHGRSWWTHMACRYERTRHSTWSHWRHVVRHLLWRHGLREALCWRGHWTTLPWKRWHWPWLSSMGRHSLLL